jgi:MFS family permease
VIKGRFEVNVNSQFALLCEHRFAPFFGVQFLGALNDNVFKNALVIMLAFQAANLTTLSSGLLVNLSAGLFILPFFLFSASAGQLADKYEKSRVIRFVKLLEIAIMALGAAGFLMQNLPLLMVALFLMGLQSTLFGPVKYAYLPQHLKSDELMGGNGLVETGTFVAILHPLRRLVCRLSQERRKLPSLHQRRCVFYHLPG